ncbi:MAG: hypothetical protein AAF541_10620 [Pseudomonadota bacterium]
MGIPSASTTALGLRVRAIILAAVLVITLLGTLFLGEEIVEPEVLTVRSIAVGLPPPPPPPPSTAETNANETPVQMNLLATGDQGEPLLQAEIAPPELQPAKMPQPDLAANLPDLESALDFDWSGFGLSELDATPQLLTDLKIRFPQRLKARGVRQAAVELNVMIDETGKVFLKEIMVNPYPALTPRIESVMRRARFTPPQKDGVKVRAVFIWPIEFRSDA